MVVGLGFVNYEAFSQEKKVEEKKPEAKKPETKKPETKEPETKKEDACPSGCTCPGTVMVNNVEHDCNIVCPEQQADGSSKNVCKGMIRGKP